MFVISKVPSVFLTKPAVEDSRLDFDYSNPEYQNTFPPNIMLKRLEKYLTDVSYGTSEKCHDSIQEDDVAVLRMNNIFDARLKLDDLVYVGRKVIGDNQLQPNDIVINRTNSKELVGKCALYEGQIEASYASYLIRLRVDERKVYPAFLVLYLSSKHGRNEINKRSCGTANQYNISIGHIKSFAFPELQKSDQEKIVSRYKSVEQCKLRFFSFKNNALHSLSERTSQNIDSIFASEISVKSFVSKRNNIVFLRNHLDAERLDVTANHPDYTKLVDQIRASSDTGHLADLVDESEERFNPDDHLGEEVRYLAIGDIDGITAKIIEPQKMLAEELPSRARRFIHAGDILVGIAGASTGTENMVVFPVTREQEGWVATTGFLVLRPRDGVDIHYVCSLLKAPFVLRQIRALLTSPAMPTISDTDFMQLAVPVTNSDARETTLIEINRVLKEERQLTIQLEQISEQIEQLLSEAKSNIFDLLDDDKFSAISARAMGIENAMGKIEEKLQ